MEKAKERPLESEREYKLEAIFFPLNLHKSGTTVVLISAAISTLALSVSPTLSQFISSSLVKCHQPIINDCSVVAYVTHRPRSF